MTEHEIYLVSAYVGVAIVTLAMILYVIWDARRVSARLEALEKSGVRRRSAS